MQTPRIPFFLFLRLPSCISVPEDVEKNGSVRTRHAYQYPYPELAIIGTNSTGCLNLRLTIRLKKQSARWQSDAGSVAPVRP